MSGTGELVVVVMATAPTGERTPETCRGRGCPPAANLICGVTGTDTCPANVNDTVDCKVC